VPDAVAKRMLAEVLAPQPRAGAPAQITGEEILATVAFGDGLIRKQQALGLLPPATPALPPKAAAAPADLILYLLLAFGICLLLAGWLIKRMHNYPEHEPFSSRAGYGHRPPAHGRRSDPGFWNELFRILLIFISGGRGGGRGGPPSDGGGYSGGGGRSGGGGASDKY
jgi:uncharacterized membrane protein YgcG